MKNLLKFLLISLTCVALGAGFALLASWSIYKQDMRVCMKEASRQYCEQKLK